MNEQEPEFWQVKSLTEMTSEEWESLCDGCGRCCLNKVIDADTDEIYTTTIACRLLDLKTCRCRHYKHRRKYVTDCIKFTPKTLHEHLPWLPNSCAYRLLYHGYDLPQWHPLKTGRSDSVHEAGFSIKNKGIISEDDVPDPSDWFDYIIRAK
ncbi:YcgN family cysteine cluster protein [Endozoicomonas sp. ONNA2]|uniref:YcgN family cysteine cluster protein n=1 Tax=Endozoicomonas sp. ONNA2 TaxID=2828741 RepID=UPI00214782FC|nr:YcgN family cysteine cluster protein [Endozoicomonas sp. ONNA2]